MPSSADPDGDEGLQNYDEFLDQSDVGTLNRAERRARAKLRMKKARRANVPVARNGDDADGNDGQLHADVQNDAAEDAGLSRKERQKAAKALEREERKASAEIARARREVEQKKRVKKQSYQDSTEDDIKMLRIDKIFPQWIDSNSSFSYNHIY